MLEVSPTRMELLKLKRRTVVAKRGHKLLKDKQYELIRRLLELVKTVKELRERVDREIAEASGKFAFARASMDPEEVEEAFLIPTKQISTKVTTKRLMTVSIPSFEEKISGEMIPYSFATTSAELDVALLAIEKALSSLMELAEKEKGLQLLADEIEKTRRRVNALEYVLIPELEETVKYISMKLSEMERGDLMRLMRIKDIVRAH
jgi:V/A-type H+-transporting ATPase subunit D